MALRWELHTLDGRLKAPIGPDHTGGVVRKRMNDMRTGNVTISIYDEAARYVTPNDTLLKAWYLDDPDPIFSGTVLMPDWQGENATLEIAAQDTSYRLDTAPLLLNPLLRSAPYWSARPGLAAVWQPGAPPVFRSLDHLIEAARPPAYGFGDPLIPDHGVAPHQYLPGAMPRGPMPIMEIQRGESVWSLMRRLSASVFGPDFDLRPITQVPGSWDHAVLDIWRRRGRELQDDPAMVFHYRHGKNNVVDCGYRPGGDQVVNNFFSAYTLGGGDQERVVNYYDPDSMRQYGFIGRYESAGCNGSAGKGIAQVAAYRQPPRYFTFQPAIEGHVYAGREDETFGVPPRVLLDYDMGDALRVIAKRGHFVQDLVGRVQEIALIEADQAGSVQAEVTVVPRVGVDGIKATTEEA